MPDVLACHECGASVFVGEVGSGTFRLFDAEPTETTSGFLLLPLPGRLAPMMRFSEFVVFTPPLGHYATRLGASIWSAFVAVPA